MNDRERNELREAGWRRALTAAEEARLQAALVAQPDVLADLEADANLTQMLNQLPDAPLSSNFTAQVMQAVEREAATARHVPLRERIAGWWPRPLPRVVWVGGFLVLALAAYQQYQSRHEQQVAQGLVRFTHAAALKEPTVFQDFEVIQRLAHTPAPADEELWVVLNQSQ
jgi:hypothetical protein